MTRDTLIADLESRLKAALETHTALAQEEHRLYREHAAKRDETGKAFQNAYAFYSALQALGVKPPGFVRWEPPKEERYTFVPPPRESLAALSKAITDVRSALTMDSMYL